MYKALFVVSLVLSVPLARAVDFTGVPFTQLLESKNSVESVQLLESRQSIENVGNTHFRYLVVKLGITAMAGRATREVRRVAAQASLDCERGASDNYYQLHSERANGTGFQPQPIHQENVSVELSFLVDYRPASEASNAWPSTPREIVANQFTQYLNFDAGWVGGYNRWKLYHLDYSNLNNVRFTYRKMYASVQGESVRLDRNN